MNWLQGSPTTVKPRAAYFSCSSSRPVYCGVSPHLLATLTSRAGLPPVRSPSVAAVPSRRAVEGSRVGMTTTVEPGTMDPVRAMVVDEAGAEPEVREVPSPSAPPGGVVVRVLATGMCRSDWHGWAGHDDDIVFPHVPGHELAGVVVEVGARVTRWRVGDRVTVPFVCGCGRCAWCLAGDAQVCPDQQQPGFTYWGSFAEEVVLHAADTNLVALPAGVD